MPVVQKRWAAYKRTEPLLMQLTTLGRSDMSGRHNNHMSDIGGTSSVPPLNQITTPVGIALMGPEPRMY